MDLHKLLVTAGLLAVCHVGQAKAEGGAPPLQGSVPRRSHNKVPASERPGYHVHDGFYLNVHAGAATAASDATAESGTDFSLSGDGNAFGVAAGSALTPNWIVFGEAAVVSVSAPTAKVNGKGVPLGTQPQSFDSGGIGAGAAYYLGPSNLFVSGSLMLTWFSVTDANGGEQTASRPGPGITLKVGKEWWISPNWALGALCGIYASSTRDEDDSVTDPATWQTRSAFLSFSATYN